MGAARAYQGLLAAWVLDDVDAALAAGVERLGIRAGVTNTIMGDENDDKAAQLASFALELIS